MSLRSDLYDLIKSHLETNVSEIQEIHYGNAQLENEQNEFPYLLPMVTIQFDEIEWSDKLRRVQHGEVSLVVKLYYENLKDDDTGLLDLADKINSFLHGFGVSGYGQKWLNPMLRRTENQDNNHGRVQIHEITYSTLLTDTGVYDRLRAERPDANVNDLVIKNELDIDNTNIRTGDGTF